MVSDIKAKTGEDIAGLTVHATAGDAVANTNAVTTIEEFTAKPVGLYDTEKGEWLNVSKEDLSNPSVINNYKAEGGKLAVALGDSLEEAEGFMNLKEYIEQVDFKPDNNGEKQDNLTSQTNNENIEIKSETTQNPNITLHKLEGGEKAYSLNDRIKEMGIDQEDKITFDGHEAELKKYGDNTSTIHYKNEDGSDTWYRYDENQNLTEIRQRGENGETIKTLENEKEVNTNTPETAANSSQTNANNGGNLYDTIKSTNDDFIKSPNTETKNKL